VQQSVLFTGSAWLGAESLLSVQLASLVLTEMQAALVALKFCLCIIDTEYWSFGALI
jgi:hypothetical protein